MVHEAKSGEKACPKCKSSCIDIVDEEKVLICFDCGYEGLPNTGL